MSGRTGDRSSLPRAALHILSWNSLRFGGTLSFQDILFLAKLAQRSLDFKRTFKIHKSIPTGLKLFSLAQVFRECVKTRVRTRSGSDGDPNSSAKLDDPVAIALGSDTGSSRLGLVVSISLTSFRRFLDGL